MAKKITKPRPAKSKWTVMIYMAGDNNLNDEMIRAIIEMRARIDHVGKEIAGKPATPKLNDISFILEFDGDHPVVPSKRFKLTFDTKSPGTYMNTSRPVDLPGIPLTPALLANGATIGEVEQRIGDLVQHCFDQHKADHYALILSGHSDAFLGRTLLIDQSPSGIGTLKGIREIIAAKFPTKDLDILAFDGCVMNSLEVAHEFRNVAKIQIGSQGSIPNYTWDYARLAAYLMETDSNHLDANRIINAINMCVKEYNCPFAFGGRHVDVSAIDLPSTSDAATAVNAGGTALLLLLYSYLPETLIGAQIHQVLLKAHWNCQAAMQGQMVDLKDFLIRIKNECIKSIRIELNLNTTKPGGNILNENDFSKREIAAIVAGASATNPRPADILFLLYLIVRLIEGEIAGLIKKGSFVGADSRYCNGVSVFFPWSFVGYKMAKIEYAKLDFHAPSSGWLGFVKVYAALTARPRYSLAQIPAIDAIIKQLIQIITQALTLSTLPGSIHAGSRKFKAGGRSPSSSVGAQIIGILNSITTQIVDQLVVESILDTKDSPPFNRGVESYLHYFGRTNNFKPDLNLAGEFPGNVPSQPCP